MQQEVDLVLKEYNYHYSMASLNHESIRMVEKAKWSQFQAEIVRNEDETRNREYIGIL